MLVRPIPFIYLAGTVYLLAAHGAFADTIVVDGTTIEKVYVSEGQSRYYIQFPSDGTVISVDRESVSSVSLAEPSERAALRAAWTEKNRGPAEAPPTDETPDPPTNTGVSTTSAPRDTRAEYDRFAQRKELEDLARFEAEFNQWRRLTDADRARLTGGLVVRKVSAQQIASTGLDKLDQQLNTIAAERQEASALKQVHAENFEQLGDEKTEAIRDAYANNYELYYFSDRLDDTLNQQFLEYLYDIDNPFTPYYVYKYARRARGELAESSRQAADAAAYYDAQRAAELSRLAALEGKEYELEQARLVALRKSRSVAALAEKNTGRTNARLARFAALEQALATDYEPILQTHAIATWRGSGNMTTPDFSSDATISRIDFDASSTGISGVDLSATLYTKDGDRPIAHFKWGADPLDRFTIVDKPGQYYLKIDAGETTRYKIVALELRLPATLE